MNDTSHDLKGVVAELEEYLTTVILGGVCYITEKVSEFYIVQEMYINITDFPTYLFSWSKVFLSVFTISSFCSHLTWRSDSMCAFTALLMSHPLHSSPFPDFFIILNGHPLYPLLLLRSSGELLEGNCTLCRVCISYNLLLPSNIVFAEQLPSPSNLSVLLPHILS